jgi:outer membrane protein assembly factor BamB
LFERVLGDSEQVDSGVRLAGSRGVGRIPQYQDISDVWLLAFEGVANPGGLDHRRFMLVGCCRGRTWMSSKRRPWVTPLLAVAFAACTVGGLGTATSASAVPNPVADPDASVAYQHDPAHDGNSPDTSFVAPLTKAWSTTLGGTVGYPLIADGRIFVTVAHASGYGNDVEALSLSTGDVVWGPTSIGGTYWKGSIAYDAGQVFAVNFDGRLTALDAATGAVNWTTQLAGQYAFTSPPTAVDGTVYVGGAGSGGTLYAVDEATGSTTWTAHVWNGDDSSPAVDATGVYVSYACEQAYKFDLSGSLVWHHDTDCEGGGGRTPVLHDGKVYVRDAGNKPPVTLDAATGAETATFSDGQEPAFDGRHMAMVSDGVLTVSDATSGGPVWHTTGHAAFTAPLIANGYVIEGRSDGTVEARLVQNGHLAWSGQAGAALDAPNAQNDTVLTGLAQGDGALVVPAGSTLTVFAPAGDTSVDLTSGPAPGRFVRSSATFDFTSGVRNAKYVCALDGKTEPCTSPVRLSNLAHGTHRFSVSVAFANNGAATRTFKADTIAPTVRVARFSPQLIHARSVTARWSASDPGSGVAAYQARTRQARIGRSFPSWFLRVPTTATSASLHVLRHSKLCVSVRVEDRVGNWSGWPPAQCVRRP